MPRRVQLLKIKGSAQLFPLTRNLSESLLSGPVAYAKNHRMDVANLIQDYGYLAVALGSFLEGEAVLLAGSLAAYHGHLALPLVLAIAAVASFAGDLPYFFAGRRFGPSVGERFPFLWRRMGQVDGLLHRHQVTLVLTLRFLYGLRIAGLLALGMSRMSTARFLLLDFLGALIWSGTICAAGYGTGRLFHALLEHGATREQLTLVAAILAGTGLLWIIRRRNQSSRSRR